METIKVRYYVSPAAAVRAGKIASGAGEFTPTEAGVQVLEEGDRALLARYVLQTYDAVGTKADEELSSQPTLAQVIECLRARDAKENAEKEAKRKKQKTLFACGMEALSKATPEMLLKQEYTGFYSASLSHLKLDYDVKCAVEDTCGAKTLMAQARVIADQRNAEVKAAQDAKERAVEAEKAAKDKRFKEACAEFVRGKPELEGRYNEGLLSDDELLLAIRDAVFEPLDAFKRYKKMTSRDIGQCDCGCEDSAQFSVEDDEPLTQEQYEMLCSVRRVMPDATCQPRVHEAYCERCREAEVDDGTVTVAAVLVSMEWHGRKLSREYVL